MHFLYFQVFEIYIKLVAQNTVSGARWNVFEYHKVLAIRIGAA